jgi:hypothetical protein
VAVVLEAFNRYGCPADLRAHELGTGQELARQADQLRAVKSLEVEDVRPASFDGDTPMAERDWVRAHARWVFTNPDMLHRGILPAHARWASFFRRLKYVVVDECHGYRGVFGSHVALLLRRLRRVAAKYGRAWRSPRTRHLRAVSRYVLPPLVRQSRIAGSYSLPADSLDLAPVEELHRAAVAALELRAARRG